MLTTCLHCNEQQMVKSVCGLHYDNTAVHSALKPRDFQEATNLGKEKKVKGRNVGVRILFSRQEGYENTSSSGSRGRVPVFHNRITGKLHPWAVGGRGLGAVAGRCRRAGPPAAARMPPGALAPLDPHKTRALTTYYAPRKTTARKNKTALSRMLDEIPLKPSLSPFHPLPAIPPVKSKPKVILFDLDKTEGDRPLKIHDMLKPLTPSTIRSFVRKNSLDQLKKPHQLVRENTYDVIEPIYLKIRKRDTSLPRRKERKDAVNDRRDEQTKDSPKTRFKKAALQVAKLSSMPEKLLCLRERQTMIFCNPESDKTTCKLEELPQSPSHNLDKVSEIFRNLELRGRHRDKMKKENSWF
ncbi:hypothetical protein ACJJTC_008581 [Scirpophaga incertulas]